MVGVLEEDDGRVDLLRQLLSRNGDAAGIFEAAEKLQLIVAQNRDAGGTGIDLDYQRRALAFGSAKRGKHGGQNHSRVKSSVAKRSFIVFNHTGHGDGGHYANTIFRLLNMVGDFCLLYVEG